jgi:hypothetical protein
VLKISKPKLQKFYIYKKNVDKKIFSLKLIKKPKYFSCNIVAFDKKNCTFATLLHYKNYTSMKKIILSVLGISLSAIVFFSCTKEHNHVNIEFLSPVDNATVADPSTVNLKIKFTAEVELEGIEVKLMEDSTGASIAPFNPMNIHEHVKEYTLDETVNLSSYPAGTEFHLDVTACENHDCSEKVTKSIHFKK